MNKKVLSIFIFLTLSLSIVMCACNKQTSTPTQTTATETTQQKIDVDSKVVFEQYFASAVEGDNPLYGTWNIENFDYVSFIFRNDGLAELAMGTEGSFSELKMDENEKTLSTTFLFGLKGEYNYELSDDENTITLTVPATGETTVLLRQDPYNFVPDVPKKPVIDENILGWWKGDNGQIYYFGKDGIMYSHIITSETCYTYEAKDGEINAIYDCGGEVTYDVKYEYKEGTLTIDGNEYKPFDPFEE